jgi:hypothetical protein
MGICASANAAAVRQQIVARRRPLALTGVLYLLLAIPKRGAPAGFPPELLKRELKHAKASELRRPRPGLLQGRACAMDPAGRRVA